MRAAVAECATLFRPTLATSPAALPSTALSIFMEKILMAYYQEIVSDFIAASRRIFVSPEYRIELGNGNNFWIDVLAIEPRIKKIYLCQTTYDKNLSKLNGDNNKIGKIEKLNSTNIELRQYIINKTHVEEN